MVQLTNKEYTNSWLYSWLYDQPVVQLNLQLAEGSPQAGRRLLAEEHIQVYSLFVDVKRSTQSATS